MPSSSAKQHRFMEAIAHSPSFAKKAGVPQKVGRDFARADDKAGITKQPSGSPKSRADHMASRARHMTQAEVGAEFGKHPSTVSRAIRRGFSYEGSAADEAADRAGAKKAGMTQAEWERSPQDRAADAKGQRAMGRGR